VRDSIGGGGGGERMGISVLEGSLTSPVRPSYKVNVEMKHCNDLFGYIKGGEFLTN
jgi:hypothetical protein